MSPVSIPTVYPRAYPSWHGESTMISHNGGMSFQRDWHYLCMKYWSTWIYHGTSHVSPFKIIVKYLTATAQDRFSLPWSMQFVTGDKVYFCSGWCKLTFHALVSSLMTQLYNSTKRELTYLWPCMIISRCWETYQEKGHALIMILKW